MSFCSSSKMTIRVVWARRCFFPDVSCLDHVTDEVKNLVAENVLSLLSRVPNDGLSQCILAGGVGTMQVEVQVEPANRNRIWREPVNLKLPTVKWQQSPDIAKSPGVSIWIDMLAVRLTNFRSTLY